MVYVAVPALGFILSTALAFYNRSPWAFALSLGTTAYLMQLNGYFHGTLKHWIDGFLGVMLVVLVISCFAFFGWKMGLLSIAFAILCGAVTMPLVVRNAAWALRR